MLNEPIISIQELREQLPAIIKRVEAGETFTLVYRSRPVGQLTPLSPKKSEKSSLFKQLADPNPTLLFKNKKGAVALIRQQR